VRIWAVCKDPGGTAGILPVVAELRSRGHEVQLIVNGWAAENVEEGSWKIESDAVATLVTGKEPMPDLLLTSTCSNGGTGMWLINWLKGACPTVALQDIWGGNLVKEYWRNPRVHPDHVLVNDSVGEDILLRAWPEIEYDQIHVVGWPALDRYQGFDVSSERARVRAEHGLDDGSPVVLFLGSGTNTSETFRCVVRALNRVRGHFQLIARPHPRMRTDFRSEVTDWDAVCSGYDSELLLHTSPESIDDAIVASDLVIGSASTALIQASVMRIPGISVMHPGFELKAYREACRGLVRRFPLVDLACVHEARDFPRLCGLLEEFQEGADLGLKGAQDAAWSGVGGAARVAVDTIEAIA
jgi:hypothetical protein